MSDFPKKKSMNSNSSNKHGSARTSCVWKFLLSPVSEIKFKTIIADQFCTRFIQFSHGQWAIQNYILHSLRNFAGWKTVYEVLSENESINEKSIRLMDLFLDTTSWTVFEPSERTESSKWVSHFTWSLGDTWTRILTRMHSSRMRTDRSLTRTLPPAMHAPPPHMTPSHACPPATHAPVPCMPPCHACPPTHVNRMTDRQV